MTIHGGLILDTYLVPTLFLEGKAINGRRIDEDSIFMIKILCEWR